MKKETSIAELRPDLAEQFDFEANYPLTPDVVSAFSRRKISWVCPSGHKWINDPQHRMRSKRTDCPVCTGRVIVPYVNDLITLHPHLDAEWNYQKNGAVNPREVHRASNKKVWWICAHGHEWEETISHRTMGAKPLGCPFCSGRRFIPGVNDLESLRPDIAQQWAYDLNKPLLPSRVSVASGKKVWWECAQGHRWKTSISHRTTGKVPTNCPYCSGKRAIPGKTDLGTLHPELMEQWDYDRNQGLDPTQLRPGSTKKASWICSKGHRWEATIRARTRERATGCPYCWGRVPIPGVTDLATKYPQIAKQWDHTKNGDLKPSGISAASSRKVAWICDAGHRWEAVVASRTLAGNNCPVCSGRKPDIGRNDLRSKRPDLVLDWDEEGNDGHQPEEFTEKSKYIAAWKCRACGTKWRKAIRARNNGNRCPCCYISNLRREMK